MMLSVAFSRAHTQEGIKETSATELCQVPQKVVCMCLLTKTSKPKRQNERITNRITAKTANIQRIGTWKTDIL